VEGNSVLTAGGRCELMLKSKAISLFKLRYVPQTAGGITPPNPANYLQLPSECQNVGNARRGRSSTHTQQCVQTCCYANKEPL
jgi:hypothetical protein